MSVFSVSLIPRNNNALKDLFGYVRTVRIVSIIYCILLAISIVGLIFIIFPIYGMRISERWSLSEVSWVGERMS